MLHVQALDPSVPEVEAHSAPWNKLDGYLNALTSQPTVVESHALRSSHTARLSSSKGLMPCTKHPTRHSVAATADG